MLPDDRSQDGRDDAAPVAERRDVRREDVEQALEIAGLDRVGAASAASVSAERAPTPHRGSMKGWGLEASGGHCGTRTHDLYGVNVAL